MLQLAHAFRVLGNFKQNFHSSLTMCWCDNLWSLSCYMQKNTDKLLYYKLTYHPNVSPVNLLKYLTKAIPNSSYK